MQNPIQINDQTPETMKYLVGLGVAAEAAKRTPPETVEIKGSTYYVDASQRLVRVDVVDPKRPETTEFFSLSGVVEFIQADVDHLFADVNRRHIVKVCHPSRVELVSPLTGVANERALVATCTAKVPQIEFNEYMDTEELNIMLMTRFQECPNRAGVISVVGNIVAEESVAVADNGFNQRVTVKKGINGPGPAVITNPVYLTPLRTFHEVDQPQSPFVLRLRGEKDNLEAAVFEADGGAWKIQAVQNIAEWLRKELDGANVEVMA
jgi:hypothetical protein